MGRGTRAGAEGVDPFLRASVIEWFADSKLDDLYKSPGRFRGFILVSNKMSQYG